MVDKRNNTSFKGNVLWVFGNFKYMYIFFLCSTFIKRFTITKMIYPKQQEQQRINKRLLRTSFYKIIIKQGWKMMKA